MAYSFRLRVWRLRRPINGSTQSPCWICAAAVEPGTSLRDQARTAAGYGWGERVSYARWRDLSIGFRTSGRLARLVGSRLTSVTLTGRNLAVWSGYHGWDPELPVVAGDLGQTAYAPAPLRRSLTIRLAAEW
jgi:hypothetical protein